MIDNTIDAYSPPTAIWTQWQAIEPALSGHGFADLRRLLLKHDTPPERKDEVFAALVRLAQRAPSRAEPKSAIIACLLPGLRRIARRYGDFTGMFDAWAELLCSVLHLIAIYDLDRRPRKIAANLLWDATARLLRSVRKERAWRSATDLSTPAEPFSAPPLDTQDVLAEAVRAGVLATQEAVLIRSTRLGTVPLTV